MSNFNSNCVCKSKNITSKVIPILKTLLLIVAIITIILFAFFIAITIFKPKTNTISNTSESATATFEKYSQSLEDLETTEEYKKLCKKLAEYAGCDNAYIISEEAHVVTNINGIYVVTNVLTNVYWIITENKTDSDLSSYRIEDLGVFYSEYDCSYSAAKPGYINPEKFIQKSCKLSSEVEKELGYTTEQIVEIYIKRFNIESDNSHSKFKTEPME